MTTVAYKDGVMAADRMLVGGNIADCEMCKLARNDRGDIIGASGRAAFLSAVLAWFAGGEKHDAPLPTKDDDGEAVIARKDGTVELLERLGIYRVETSCYATGSGKDLAYGAMAFGASAAEAVKCAAKYDVYTGADVDQMSIREAE